MLMLASCSDNPSDTGIAEAEKARPEAIETSSVHEQASGALGVKETPALEPVRKDIRIIVEDEVGLIEPETDTIERVVPAISAEEKNAAELARLPEKPDKFARPLILAANDIKSGEISIRLTGISAPEKEKTCETATGGKWPCGNFAKAALQRLVRARTLTCEGDYVSGNRFEGRCSVGKTDLSQWLVARGWAESSDGEFRDLMQIAKKDSRGMWRQ